VGNDVVSSFVDAVLRRAEIERPGAAEAICLAAAAGEMGFGDVSTDYGSSDFKRG